MCRWNIQQRRAAELYRLSSWICMSFQNRWLSSAVLSRLLHTWFGSGLSLFKSFCWSYLRHGKYVLWEHESTGKCFHNVLQVFLWFDRNRKSMFSISCRKLCEEKKKTILFTMIIMISILFTHSIIMSTSCASSVFLYTCSYGNTILAYILLAVFWMLIFQENMVKIVHKVVIVAWRGIVVLAEGKCCKR